MAKFVFPRRLATFTVGAVAFCAALYVLRAEGEPKPDDTALKELAEADPFAVPQTEDPAELLKFIDGVRASRPPRPRDAASYRKHVKYNRAAGPAIAEASKKILSLADKQSADYSEASGFLLEAKITGFTEADEDGRRKMLDDVIAHLKEFGVREKEAGVAYGISEAFEQTGDTKTAARAYKEFAELVKTSESEEIRDLATTFAGASRRLNLVGSEMEVFGKTLDGKDFDWGQFKGKVVLVDFWATWCGPCIEELPNVKEAYEKYHDKGFEVVGVNLDQRRIALDEFLEINEIPWVQLHEEGERNKLAEHYDIGPIPFIVLVGRDGKVISVEARGRELHHELEKLFASTEPPEKDTGDADTDGAEAGDAEAGE